MKEIMKSSFKSRRHDLFLVRKEREQCNGMKMSTLHRLSNPSFLGGNFEQDSTIINLITQTVFKVNDYFINSVYRWHLKTNDIVHWFIIGELQSLRIENVKLCENLFTKFRLQIKFIFFSLLMIFYFLFKHWLNVKR